MSRTKSALRGELIAARKRIPAPIREAASREASSRLAALPVFRAARSIALYAPLGAELDPGELATRAAAAGKRIAWPRIRAGERRLDLAVADPSELVRGPVGALEPPSSAPVLAPGELDLVVVPGVAFDEHGRRLGRGGGYYDATLGSLSPRCFRAGLAFDLQVVPALPVEAHDARVDAIVTESRVILVDRD